MTEPTQLEVDDICRLKERIRSEKDWTDKKKREEFERLTKYLLAGIPQEYWYLDWEDFKGDDKPYDITKLYCEHLPEALKAGQGIIFSGEHGTGKTTLTCLIGKHAIDSGYTVKYIPVAKIIDMLMEGFGDRAYKQNLDTILERVEFLLLDDIGKEFQGAKGQLNTMVKLTLDTKLRERVNRNLVTIASTNHNAKTIQEQYGESVLSVIYGSCRFVKVEGGDFRLCRGEKFWQGLETKS